HAAVGLDTRRRARVEQLLGQALLKDGVTPELQINVALTLSQFEIRDSAVARKVVQVLAQAMQKTTAPYALRELAQGLSAMAGRLQPEEAAAVRGQAATTLGQALTKTTDSYALG